MFPLPYVKEAEERRKKKIGKKRKEKEKKESIVVLGWQWREGPGAVTVCVYATGSGLPFDAFLNKGSTYLVTHVTHAGICESSQDGFKDNSLSFSRGRNFTWSCLLFFFFHFFPLKTCYFIIQVVSRFNSQTLCVHFTAIMKQKRLRTRI